MLPKTNEELQAAVTEAATYLKQAREAIRTLTAERDDARANARILAHAYEHDSRPPRRAVDASLAYPVSPARRFGLGRRPGTVTAFNPNTLYGLVGLVLGGAPLAFHSTSAGGHTYMLRRPAVGDAVTVFFSDDECTRLLSIEHRQDAP